MGTVMILRVPLLTENYFNQLYFSLCLSLMRVFWFILRFYFQYGSLWKQEIRSFSSRHGGSLYDDSGTRTDVFQIQNLLTSQNIVNQHNGCCAQSDWFVSLGVLLQTFNCSWKLEQQGLLDAAHTVSRNPLCRTVIRFLQFEISWAGRYVQGSPANRAIFKC